MKFFVLLKLLLTTLIQIELSPKYWQQLGLVQSEVYIIVVISSLIMIMVNVFVLNFGINALTANPKPHLGHKIARIIHRWGIPGLLIAGLIPWPPIVGVAQPLVYLLYCKAEMKVWYKLNMGLLILMVGIAVKMFFFV